MFSGVFPTCRVTAAFTERAHVHLHWCAGASAAPSWCRGSSARSARCGRLWHGIDHSKENPYMPDEYAALSGLSIAAPYGLSDLFGVVVRPNKVQITRAVYE